MSDKLIFSVLAGALFSSLFVVKVGSVWALLAFLCIFCVGLSRL